MENKSYRVKMTVQYGVSVLAALFLFYGVHRGEVDIVLNKAVNICLECIGLG